MVGEGAPFIRVVLTGEIDLSSVATVREALRNAVAEAPGGQMEVDLSGVTFIDSIGLGALVGAWKNAHQSGADIRLVAPPFVVKLLGITGLTRLFEVVAASPGEQ